MNEQGFWEFVNRELLDIHARIACLDRRLAEAEEKPKQILEEIERIWSEDSETGAAANRTSAPPRRTAGGQTSGKSAP